jgi:hypothetical protein
MMSAARPHFRNRQASGYVAIKSKKRGVSVRPMLQSGGLLNLRDRDINVRADTVVPLKSKGDAQ